jgi:hypothetical protein
MAGSHSQLCFLAVVCCVLCVLCCCLLTDVCLLDEELAHSIPHFPASAVLLWLVVGDVQVGGGGAPAGANADAPPLPFIHAQEAADIPQPPFL